MDGALDTASTALDVVNKGIETIKLIMRPGHELTVVEGGFAKCLPDGISDSDLDAGEDCQIVAVTSEYAGASQKAILGETLGGFLGAAWKWDLVFSWKHSVRDNGTGAYILDASADVRTELASDQIAWEWKITFPGKGRWFDRDDAIVELPFKVNVKCTHSVIYDKLWFQSVYRGWMRGNGEFLCAGQ
ncbi:hypothetical protein [Alloactinosynnema sp. L-07]|uniref:hypothetical protein n=1 Tax=Alloactinosynnema sp. L-07 TaxID=1653480 RepID=UPI00065F0051|nr:hypothetical protein [Alloactinosynnema sp. L-07]CRK55914.1 hypothetical protein [Alloactinosynnema sp. L-07]